MTSINTNVGALVALRNLGATSTGLERTQDRVSTGYRVIGAKDDASNFAIAQGLRADLKAFEAVQQSLSEARGLVSVAIAIDEDRSTPVFSPYAGRVTKLLARPGDHVEQGQPLFVIEAPDTVQAQNDFIAAATALNKADALGVRALGKALRHVGKIPGMREVVGNDVGMAAVFADPYTFDADRLLARADAAPVPTRHPRGAIDPLGIHQAGVVTPAQAHLALAAFDLLPLANRPARTLSAGQRRRAAAGGLRPLPGQRPPPARVRPRRRPGEPQPADRGPPGVDLRRRPERHQPEERGRLRVGPAQQRTAGPRAARDLPHPRARLALLIQVGRPCPATPRGPAGWRRP